MRALELQLDKPGEKIIGMLECVESAENTGKYRKGQVRNT